MFNYKSMKISWFYMDRSKNLMGEKHIANIERYFVFMSWTTQYDFGLNFQSVDSVQFQPK